MMCRVCSSDFIAVQQCHITLRATDAMVPAWQVPPGLQNLPQEKSWGYFMVSRDHRNTGTTDCLCWVFSATSTVGFFLLQGHSDTKWPSLYLWNFSHTIHQCCVSFTSLDWKDFHLSDSIFWALSCLVSLVLLQSFDSAFLNVVSRTAHSSTEDLALQSWKEYFSPTSYKNEKSPFF